MTDPNSNADIQNTESQLSPEMVAIRRLDELGIRSGEGEASYRWGLDFTAMTDAIRVVRNHGSRLPEDIQADLQLTLTL